MSAHRHLSPVFQDLDSNSNHNETGIEDTITSTDIAAFNSLFRTINQFGTTLPDPRASATASPAPLSSHFPGYASSSPLRPAMSANGQSPHIARLGQHGSAPG